MRSHRSSSTAITNLDSRRARAGVRRDAFDVHTDVSLVLLDDEPANESEVPEQSGRFPACTGIELDEAELELVDEPEQWLKLDEIEEPEDEVELEPELEFPVAEEASAQADDSEWVEAEPEVEPAGVATALVAREPAVSLCDADLEEETQALDEADVVEESPDTTVSLDDAEMEVLGVVGERKTVVSRITEETVLVYCKAGETLPPYAIPTGELPRFAMGRRALARFDVVPASIQNVPSNDGLPRFDVEPSRAAAKVPPVRLPRFQINEQEPVSGLRTRAVPPVRLPMSMRLGHLHQAHISAASCPHCQHLAILALAGLR